MPIAKPVRFLTILLLAVAPCLADVTFAGSDYQLHGQFDYPGSALINATGTDFGTIPLGINNLRQVVGIWTDPGTGATNGYFWQNGTFTPFNDPLGANGTGPGGINDFGQISGTYFDASPPFGNQHGFVCTNPGPSPTCITIDAPGTQPTSTTFFEFGPGLGTTVLGINNSGTVAGMYNPVGNYTNGFTCQATNCSGPSFTSVSNMNASNTDITVQTQFGPIQEGLGTELFGVRNNGVAAGSYYQLESDGMGHNFPILHGFILDHGTPTEIF